MLQLMLKCMFCVIGQISLDPVSSITHFSWKIFKIGHLENIHAYQTYEANHTYIDITIRSFNWGNQETGFYYRITLHII